MGLALDIALTLLPVVIAGMTAVFVVCREGAGIVTGILCMFVFPNTMSSTHVMEGIWFGTLLGAVASFIFFHVQFVLERLSKSF
ncbi:hypothetical protein [Alteribacillus iranensis]|uniref:Uncharacterized protein n=1 Tax=Alteribacillus iranensis TaxID=930128 RepID=A0A1I1ZY10_9BACI|nr:hypothetical protein [Alteribacillus iranensis]SFE35340.1 hypothetical protein SAMN05192532_101453 [Alteribacillus iranensis]